MYLSYLWFTLKTLLRQFSWWSGSGHLVNTFAVFANWASCFWLKDPLCSIYLQAWNRMQNTHIPIMIKKMKKVICWAWFAMRAMHFHWHHEQVHLFLQLRRMWGCSEFGDFYLDFYHSWHKRDLGSNRTLEDDCKTTCLAFSTQKEPIFQPTNQISVHQLMAKANVTARPRYTHCNKYTDLYCLHYAFFLLGATKSYTVSL